MAKGFTVKVYFNKDKTSAEMKRCMEAGIEKVATEALDDANEFVRVFTGRTRDSSYDASNLKEGDLVWNTPYAAQVYYTGTPSTNINPKASLLWAHVGYSTYFHKYEDIMRKAISERRVMNVF